MFKKAPKEPQEEKPADMTPETAGNTEETQPVEEPAQPEASPVQKLQQELTEAQNKLLYLQADYQNYRRRMIKELADAREEIDRLKKQLAMSDADTAAARVLFAAWQEAYRKLREKVDTLPQETGDKLRAAIKAQTQAWAGEE